ncbi:putative E3 ubiquitin-protein ligase [Sesbania bispinosa]|nr:putative E3 ubiquitin-protein ligase [Sesbania bispinosa]
MLAVAGQSDFEEEEVKEVDKGGRGQLSKEDADDANSEHDATDCPIPIENYFTRPIISPAYAPSDLNAINVMLCDTYVLDCCICSEPLSHPVFQCINGHIACDSKELALHFKTEHQPSEPPFKYGEVFVTSLCPNENIVVLQALEDDKLFVINNKAESLVNILTLYHIGPNTVTSEFHFKMVVRSQQGNNSILLESEVENIQDLQSEEDNIQDCTSASSSGSLYVPFEFFQPCGRVKLEICISMIGAAQAGDNP